MSVFEIRATAPEDGMKGLHGFEALRLADGAAPAAFRAAPLSFEDAEWPEWTDREERACAR